MYSAVYSVLGRVARGGAMRAALSSTATPRASIIDTVIVGGTVVTATDTFTADVAISGGKVLGVAQPGHFETSDSTEVIDAAGMLVLPGGVDSHCHIEQTRQMGGPLSCGELYDTGTLSAAAGGTTSVISFCQQQAGHTLQEAVDDYDARSAKAIIDYSYHLVINDATDAVVAELPSIIAQGHRSLKVFMTYPHNRLDDEGLLKVLEVARREGALVTLHCENHDAINWMTEKLLSAGLTDPKYFAWSKPAVVEREAVSRAIALAEIVDCPIQIFHVTAAEVAEEVARAQSRGLKVWGETCNITSDHAPAYFYGTREGELGKLEAGPNARFDQIANGMPGLETRMPVLFSKGVSGGELTVNEFVAATSTNAAKLFGLYPKKGTIAPGCDADIVVWKEEDWVIEQEQLHHHADYTPYEGTTVHWKPEVVIARGDTLFGSHNKPTAHAVAGRGEFLPRDKYDYIAPSGRFPTPFDPFAQ
eukprot:gene15180-16654_t